MNIRQKKIMSLIMSLVLVGSGFTSLPTEYSKVFAEDTNISSNDSENNKVLSDIQIKGTERIHNASGNMDSLTLTDNAEYVLKGDTLYISGSEYIIASYKISGNENIKKIVVEDGTKIIGKNCFKDFKNVESVSLPSSVEVICNYAFYGLDSLKSIEIPDSVTEIQNSAFSYLPKIEEISIPASVKYFGKEIIGYNNSLKKVTIHGDSTLITDSIIVSNDKLEEVVFENISGFSNGKCISNNSNPKKIVISSSKPESGMQIGDYAFNNSNTGKCEVTLPDDLTKIGNSAFYSKGYCFDKISIPQNMTTIDSRAFQYTEISDLEINGAEKIGDYAFANTKCYDNFSIKNVKEIGAYAFNQAEIKTLDLTECPDINFGKSAFASCEQLESVILPSSLGQFDNNAFAFCTKLKTIDFSSDTTGITDLPVSIFRGCTGLEKIINLPDTLQSIGVCAFYECSSLKSLKLSSTVKSIGMSAFYGCTGFESFTLPSNLESIGDYAFGECSGIKQLELPDSLKEIGYGAFSETGIKKLNIPGSVTTINAVIGNNRTNDNGEKTEIEVTNLCSEIILNKGTKEIADGAFKNNVQLKSVTIPESVTEIGETAFENCPDLTIYGVKGSAAEKYSKEHKIKFVNTDKTKDDKTDEPEEKVIYIGDMDHSGVTDLTDLTLLVVMLLDGHVDVTKYPEADTDLNGIGDIADLARLKQYISKDPSVKELGVIKSK